MADLGEFGRARAIEHDQDTDPDWFRFYGERFLVPAALSSLVSMQFVHDIKLAQDREKKVEARRARAMDVLSRAAGPAGRQAAQEQVAAVDAELVDVNLDGMASMHRYVRECIGDDQWDAFRAVCLREAVDQEELMDICSRILQAVAARPTRRSSDSSDGPSSTGGGSMGGSVSPEPTPGPPLRLRTGDETPVWGDPDVIVGEVIQMTPRERQAAEFAQLMVPVPGARVSGS